MGDEREFIKTLGYKVFLILDSMLTITHVSKKNLELDFNKDLVFAFVLNKIAYLSQVQNEISKQ